MKIQSHKLDDLIVDMLIHIQTEVQVIRNFVLTDYVEKTGKSIDLVTREYEELYDSAKTTIMAQIKSRYIDSFNADDLLSKIKE
jgi:hypothetical protein